MAYLLREDTAKWLDRQVHGHNVTGRPRRGWVLGDGGSGDVAVCYITGGDALTGYNARAYPSMAALRDDTAGTAGEAITVYPCEIGLDGHLPAGTVVLCHQVLCRVTGGSENAEPEEPEE